MFFEHLRAYVADEEPNMIRMKAGDIPPASQEDLSRLLDAMDGPIDTSDIPEKD